MVRLTLSQVKMQETGASHLFRALVKYKKVEFLNLSFNVLPIQNISRSLADLLAGTRLHTLSLNYCKIGDYGGVLIGKNLQHRRSHLRNLKLKFCELGDPTARSLANCIELDIKLQLLDLSNNLISDAGGELLAISVRFNESLQCLKLRNNDMRETSGDIFVQAMR